MASLVPLIDTYRGGTLECRHFGVVAVADISGRVLAHAGDPHWLAFTRSTLRSASTGSICEYNAEILIDRFSRGDTRLLIVSSRGFAGHGATSGGNSSSNRRYRA